MKKSIMISALFVMIANYSVAQETEDTRDKLHVGAKVGMNYANVYDSKGQDFEADSKLGLAIGGFVAIPFGTLAGIQTEVLFSQKGFQGTGRILGLNYEFTRTTSYLDIPVYFAVKPSKYITLVAGPQFSYLFAKKDVFASTVTTIEQEQEFENDNIRKNTLGASVGFDINVKPFVIGARANWDLQENNGNGTSSTPRYKNQWMQLTFGVRF